MRKRLFLIFTIIIMAVLVAGLAVGCKNAKEGEAKRISVADTHIFLAPYGDAESPYGDPSTYKIETSVYPLETADQRVNFSLKESADREYLSVAPDGTIKAKGEVKADEEGNPLDITVIATSNQNPSLSVEITVTIEEREVERIYFDSNTLIAYLSEDPVQIVPRFVPSHAIIGRNVEFSSDNSAIASVDANGLVTPRVPGKVAVWVSTPRQGAFDNPVRGFITIDARYADLNYSMSLLSEPSVLKQVYGSPEQLQFTLLKVTEECDPEPNIVWYVNTTQIDDGVSRNNPTLSYSPSALPPGEYVIRAELYNSTQSLTLTSDTLIIYEPLQAISLDLFGSASGAEYLTGDVANFIVTYTDGQYPPDQYRWKITHTSDTGVVSTEQFNRAPSGFAANGDKIADLSYQFGASGTYTIEVEAFVEGAPSGIVGRPITITVGGRGEECNVYGLKTGGVQIDGTAYAAVFWDALPYETEIVIEIDAGGKITSMSSESTEFGGYFDVDSFTVPQYVASLNNDFRVRARAGNSNWTAWIEYSSDEISAGAYQYMAEFLPGHDRYISDLQELGDLINYISLFRPTGDFADTDEDDNYRVELDLFIPINYDEDISSADYPFDNRLSQGLQGSNYNEAGRNAYKVLAAAIYSYVDTVSMTFSIATDSVLGGYVGYVLTFVSDPYPSSTPATTGGLENGEIYTHYSETPRGENGILPIESLSETMSVSTSGQLLYAVLNGYKPSVVQGSSAETVYNKAKSVLNSIIDDGMTDFEKLLAIYDWIVMNVAYDNEVDVGRVDYSDRAFYIEGALLDGVAVCDGISKTFALLASMESIHTYRVFGNAGGVSHAWNAVVVDGNVYYVDPTWANQKINWGEGAIEVITYDTFLMTETELDVDHTTYGIYPDTPDLGLSDNVYSIETGEGTDFTIDTDSEFGPLFEYLDGKVENGTVWVSVWVSMEYLNEKTDGGMTPAEVEEHIGETVTAALNGLGCDLTSTRVGKFGNSGWELKLRINFGE